MKILITGGAGFVGHNLAKFFKEKNQSNLITCFDNLKRRGSEINVPSLKKIGAEFVHGDVRNPQDLSDLPTNYDLIIEASAEPSVLAGTQGSPDYILDTNLTGAKNCLEFARRKGGAFLFLSTSRIYSIGGLQELPLVEQETRFEIAPQKNGPGFSNAGICEDFEVKRPRSFYGTSKLAAEYLCQEYQYNYKIPCLINRCGVISGPGQFGKADQGVFTLWVANHYFKKPLAYTGFGGTGKQVRDLLHPADLFALLEKQIATVSNWNADVYNVGGAHAGSMSLLEFTGLCEKVTGNKIEIASNKTSASVDVPYYVSDISKVQKTFGWSPQIKPEKIVQDIHSWIKENETKLKEIF